MKMIAHRGASLERTENTLESLLRGSALGAYAVECDLRLTKDGKYVLFHDDTLTRLSGDDRRVSDLTEDEMRISLAKVGIPILTFDDILHRYEGTASVLLDLTLPPQGYTDEFFRMLSEQPVRFVCGVHAVSEAETAQKYFPAERILAFMPDMRMYEDFFRAGAGCIRLWEQWLDRVTPADVHAACPGAEVWIMSNRPGTGMNGTRESLEALDALGADGVLLNDIRLGMEYEKNK